MRITEIIIWGLVFSVAITIPGGVFPLLKFSLAYFLLFYLPFSIGISSMNLDIVESFVLNNVLGLSYAGIYVLLDVVFSIRLTLPLFILGGGLMAGISTWLYLKYQK